MFKNRELSTNYIDQEVARKTAIQVEDNDGKMTYVDSWGSDSSLTRTEVVTMLPSSGRRGRKMETAIVIRNETGEIVLQEQHTLKENRKGQWELIIPKRQRLKQFIKSTFLRQKN